MMPYQNEMYHLPPYEGGESWNWQSSWSETFEHVPYEQQRCSVEMYEEGQWGEYSSEWTAPESWSSSQVVPEAQAWTQPQSQWSNSTPWEGQSTASRWPESSMMMTQVKMPGQAQAATAPAQACQSSLGSPCGLGQEPKGGDEVTELRLAELKRLIDRDAQALRSNPKAVLQEQVESSESTVGTSHAAEPSEACPVLQQDAPEITGEVKVHRVLVAFEPKSRQSGEMPLRADEEVTVRYPPTEEWIFGWKGYPAHDQGWIPAQNLGIGVSIEEYSDDEAEPSPEPKAKEKVEAWHHHGQWWSRQRHLKVDSSSAKKDIGDVRRRPQTDPAELQQSRLASSALAAATAKSQQAAKGRGKGGRGTLERRDRTALSIQLDRLSKPLVVEQAKKN